LEKTKVISFGCLIQKEANHKCYRGVRLAQAGWRVTGRVIDQTTYFRYELFGGFEWSTGLRRPKKRETTGINFDINILEINYGVYELTISHKPSGEARQGNYTTMLHWGVLANIVSSLNLVGRTFHLYAPIENSDIFTIEIT
jgi:hypothetical protein